MPGAGFEPAASDWTWLTRPARSPDSVTPALLAGPDFRPLDCLEKYVLRLRAKGPPPPPISLPSAPFAFPQVLRFRRSRLLLREIDEGACPLPKVVFPHGALIPGASIWQKRRWVPYNFAFVCQMWLLFLDREGSKRAEAPRTIETLRSAAEKGKVPAFFGGHDGNRRVT